MNGPQALELAARTNVAQALLPERTDEQQAAAIDA
jgi:hypothetical protein